MYVDEVPFAQGSYDHYLYARVCLADRQGFIHTPEIYDVSCVFCFTVSWIWNGSVLQEISTSETCWSRAAAARGKRGKLTTQVHSCGRLRLSSQHTSVMKCIVYLIHNTTVCRELWKNILIFNYSWNTLEYILNRKVSKQHWTWSDTFFYYYQKPKYTYI